MTAVNVGIAGYLALLTAAGARPPRPIVPHRNAATRFAILVPAHNEQAIISGTLAAFGALRYDRASYEVHVVADNCTDRTAAIVREHGWTVHERDAPDDPGKGPALNWLRDRLDRDRPGAFDVAVVVDADTVVHPDFLVAMDQAFDGGAVAAQGYYSVLEPETSASAGVRYAALASRHHLRPLGRNRLGASAGLYGNGMAFTWDILGRRRWTGHLVEDAEFQMELLLRDGIRIEYVPGARLEAEMPVTLDASSSQNERWERGRIDLARRYVPELVRTIRTAPAGRRIAYTDAIVDHLVPPLSVVILLQGAGLALLTPPAASGNRRAIAGAAVHVAAIAAVVVHVVVALRSVNAPGSVWRSLTDVPKIILWKVRLWARALAPSSEVTWQRTQRNAEQ
jgi:cellulose synthase/poly-beta-1,6-N-acetylglucosamine synthase-like glycosyltransferase